MSATVEASNFKFGIQLGLGEELAMKQLLGPKLARVRARGASQKMWKYREKERPGPLASAILTPLLTL